MQETQKCPFSSLVLQERQNFFRSSSLCNPLPGSIFEENANEDIYCTGIDYPLSNRVIEKKRSFLSEEDINNIVQLFASKKLPFIWWTPNKNLENFGFQFCGTLTEIALDMLNKELQSPTLAQEVTIELVQSEEKIKIFSKVAVEAFGMPINTSEQFTEVNFGTMKAKEQMHFFDSQYTAKLRFLN